MVNVNINLSNRWLYSILAVIIVILAGVAVWAYTEDGSGVPSVMGHSADELDVDISGTIKTLQEAIDAGDIGVDTRCDVSGTCTNVYASGDISLTGSSKCIIFASTGKICSG